MADVGVLIFFAVVGAYICAKAFLLQLLARQPVHHLFHLEFELFQPLDQIVHQGRITGAHHFPLM